jgi:hypothetical protein
MIDEQVTAVMECEDLDNACTLSYDKETNAPKKEAALKMKGQFGYDEIIKLFGRAFFSEVEFGFNFLMTNKLKITITIEKAE